MTRFAATVRSFLAGKTPGQLIIQLTDRCNAKCPQCGMRVTQPFQRTTLSRKTVYKTLVAAGAKKVAAVSFTGGEPLLMLTELTDLIKYAGRCGIDYIRTGTNGFIFSQPEKAGYRDKIKKIAEQLAETPLRNLWISIDSAVAETHEQMRGFPGIIKGIEIALPIFHAVGIYPSANLGVNRNMGGDLPRLLKARQFSREEDYLEAFFETYRKAADNFYTFVGNLGFSMASTCYPMSLPESGSDDLSAVYQATSTDDVVRFSRAEKALLFKALLQTIPKHRSDIRIFSPLCSLETLHKQFSNGNGLKGAACRGGLDYFYVAAKDGNTYPCGYRGKETFGKFWQMTSNASDSSGDCYQCEWECFRDPTELLTPFVALTRDFSNLIKRFKNGMPGLPNWIEDMAYFWACDYFDGRKPPNLQRLSHFKHAQSGLTPLINF